MKYCYKHNREYNDICRFCDEEFIPASSKKLETIILKKCTYRDCVDDAKHQEVGSIIALCDKHEKEINDGIRGLFDKEVIC